MTTFKDWYYNIATAEERAEAREVGVRTAGMDGDRMVRERTAFKLRKLCIGRGWTIEQDNSWRWMRWRVVPAKGDELMQFADAESALVFARDESKTVANWLRTIVSAYLVMPDGKAVLL